MLHFTFEQFNEFLFQNQKLEEQEDLTLKLYHTTYTSSIDNAICRGSAISTTIREGITLLMLQLTFNQNTKTELKNLVPQIGFMYCLKGKISFSNPDTRNKKHPHATLDFTPRVGYVYVSAQAEGWYQFEAGRPFKAIYIHFSYEAFRQLLGEQLEELPVEFLQAMKEPDGHFLTPLTISSSLMALCAAIFNNPYSGKSKQFYCEAKVIELIAYQIDRLSNLSEEANSTGLRLTLREETLLEYCYEVISSSLKNPPSIIELAREVGMSDYRLKNGFKQKFGLTPYRFLLERRMLKAKELLLDGRMNVTEVADSVGFTSLGSFSNSFYEKFGIRPSDIK